MTESSPTPHDQSYVDIAIDKTSAILSSVLTIPSEFLRATTSCCNFPFSNGESSSNGEDGEECPVPPLFPMETGMPTSSDVDPNASKRHRSPMASAQNDTTKSPIQSSKYSKLQETPPLIDDQLLFESPGFFTSKTNSLHSNLANSNETPLPIYGDSPNLTQYFIDSLLAEIKNFPLDIGGTYGYSFVYANQLDQRPILKKLVHMTLNNRGLLFCVKIVAVDAGGYFPYHKDSNTSTSFWDNMYVLCLTTDPEQKRRIFFKHKNIHWFVEIKGGEAYVTPRYLMMGDYMHGVAPTGIDCVINVIFFCVVNIIQHIFNKNLKHGFN